MIAILAVLKAGGAYLPIPPKSPDARVSFLLKDSDALILLTQSRFLPHEFCFSVANLINLENISIYQGDDSCLKLEIDPHDLVYVIYTSGTTGKPKGVMIEHHSMSNRLIWMQNRYPLGRDDVILQKTCYSFDVQVTAYIGGDGPESVAGVLGDNWPKDASTHARQGGTEP